MADENKIQLEVELSESSIDKSFKAIDARAEKSAKESAAVFGEYFQKQETELKSSIDRIVGDTSKVAKKAAKESAAVFAEEFARQDKIYKASVKQSIDNALDAITGASGIKKSAQESASVFEEAFAKEITGNKAIDNALNAILPDANATAAFGTGLSRLIIPIAAVSAGLFALKAAAQETLDLVVMGEKEIKLDKKFEVLATEAGITADVLKNDLNAAVEGLVDEGKLLELASESFIQLGNNARQLPEVLELARKTYAVFGGDIVKNTEAITNAVFTGQTRQLKQLGILVDTEKVYKEYARSVGTVVPLLSEQQRQTALLNAVLEQGNERFRNVETESGKATGGIQRFKVQVTELIDQISILSANTLGKTIGDISNQLSTFISTVNRGFQAANRSSESVEALQDKIKILTGSIKNAEDQLKNFNAVERLFLGGDFQDTIDQRTKELVQYQKQLEDATKRQAALQSQVAPVADTPQVSDEFLRRKQELVAKVQSLNDQVNQSEIQLAQAEFQRLQNTANLEKLTYEQRKSEAEKYLQDRSMLEKFYADNGVNDEMIRQQGREALEAAHVNRLLLIQQNYEQQRKQIFDTANVEILTVGDAFIQMTEGMQIAAQELSVNAAKNFKNLGKAMLTNIGQAAGNAFAAFGQAIGQGENALEAFGKSLLNSLGNAAIQMGTTFILQGIAYTYAGLANGPPLIAAGAALAAAGGLLAASQGAGPNDGGGSASAGGGGLDTTPVTTLAPEPEDIAPTTPQTSINLTINGNVLDRRETGLEIAQILEEQFAEQGLVIRGA